MRLGEINTQTRWVLDRAGARPPDFLPHVMLRVSDVMRKRFPQAEDAYQRVRTVNDCAGIEALLGFGAQAAAAHDDEPASATGVAA